LSLPRDSKIETYQKMWRFMESNEAETFVHSYEAGVERVLGGNYAFLCESTMLDYLVQRNCNLTQIGGLLDNKGYGIATPKGSKWKERISQAVLFLQVSERLSDRNFLFSHIGTSPSRPRRRRA
jgi:ionotropic glutamate receptor